MNGFGNASDGDHLVGAAPWLQTAWDLRAAGNFIGGGSGSGLLLAVAIAGALGGASPALVAGGLALVAAGLFSVFLEIGKPLRAINVLFGARRSWMTREAYVATVLFPLGLAALQWPALTPILALPALPYMYCQARMLKASKGIPAWREPRIVPLILSSAVTEGTGILLLLSAALGLAVPAWTMALLLAAVAARSAFWRAYHGRLADGKVPARVVPLLARFAPRFLLAANALPAALLVAAMLRPEWAAPAAALAGLAAAAGGWAMKIFIITKIAFNQGFAIPVSPARGKGPGGPGTAPGWG